MLSDMCVLTITCRNHLQTEVQSQCEQIAHLGMCLEKQTGIIANPSRLLKFSTYKYGLIMKLNNKIIKKNNFKKHQNNNLKLCNLSFCFLGHIWTAELQIFLITHEKHKSNP